MYRGGFRCLKREIWDRDSRVKDMLDQAEGIEVMPRSTGR